MSETYTKLLATAHEFIETIPQLPPPTSGSAAIDVDRVRAIRSPDFRHCYGHSYMVARAPDLQTMSTDQFIEHAGKVVFVLKTWKGEVRKTWVDERSKEVVLQAVYKMTPKGVPETDGIDHEIIWTLKMDDAGEKVVEATEFLDAMALKDLGELIRAAMAKGP